MKETSSFANHFISADFRSGLLALVIQTNFGSVKVRDIRFMGSNGTEMSALTLYT